jgi:hypothetical protein
MTIIMNDASTIKVSKLQVMASIMIINVMIPFGASI